MDLLIKAKDIRVEYAGQEVLDIEELMLYDYDRIGLVGRNGAGKSTLLKVLSGEFRLPHFTIMQQGNFSLIPQLDDVAIQENRNYALMGKLGVNSLETKNISGGEETRLKIAQALSNHVHGILADEPTCHLDRSGIDFLIGQFKQFSGALLIVSHDRYFLDAVIDKIWELKDGKIIEYWGGYSDYLRQKEEERQNQLFQYEQIASERNRLEQAIKEKQKQARKIEQKSKKTGKKNTTESGGRLSHQKTIGIKQKKLHTAAKNMEQRIALLDNVQAPEVIRTIRFRKSKILELHNSYPITGNDVCKRFGEKILFDKASFQIPLGTKVALTGGNGTGKTTLFRMIMDRENGINVSPKAEIGYFPQSGYKYNKKQNVMEFMQEDCDYKESEIRSVLASMGFAQCDIRKELSVLSGGEIIKLLLSKMLLGRYNILLMDEPSNFLDLPSIEALENLMKNYAGTIFFISHDVRLIENIADRIYKIEEGKIMV